MSQKYEKLKNLLKELFQLDQPDLDFGFYRVMHARSAEVTQFLDKDLLPQVKAAFAQYQPADKAEIEKKLAKAIEQAQALGADPETLPKVKELRTRLAEDAVDLDALEAEVYDHLFSFFRRYYSEGDFLSKRVYKPGVYAIPYEGEEVKLHWANADQYYIKTSEYLRDYAFRLRPDDEENPMRVHFRLVDASEGEHGNVKEAAGKERRFKLAQENVAMVEDGELVIRFTFGPDPAKQKELNAAAETAVLELADASLGDWVKALGAKHVRADGTAAEATRLRVHIDRYTARNTFDYFIHKDLGGFLRRELDFYIKNEVMHLDDVENESAPRVEQYLSKIKVIRGIAGKIIEFLAQLENFQKKLWLKKKFVVEKNYRISLHHIPESLYQEVADNISQREEWARLFSINDINGDLAQPAYSIPLTVEFLRANKGLLIDTRFFTDEFVSSVLDAIPHLSDSLSGVVVAADASQASRLLQRWLANRASVVIADPPYNTGSDGFAYKDTYQHSSWLSLQTALLEAAQMAMKHDAICACFIDDNELHRLGMLMDQTFGEVNRAACSPWKSEASGGKEKTGLRTGHEYILIYHNGDGTSIAQTEISTGELDREDKWGRYRKGRELRKWGGASARSDRPGQWFPLPTPDGSVAWPVKNDGAEGHWRWGKENTAIKSALQDPEVFHWEKCTYDAGVSVAGARERWVPFQKIRDVKKAVGWSTWLDGVGTNADATRELKAMFGTKPFETPKPSSVYRWLIALHCDDDGLVLDFVAGSGTAAQAVIDLNAEDGSNRSFVVADSARSAKDVIWPRVAKASYSREWKEGKPLQGEASSPRLFGLLHLESYEDTLNNLELRRTREQQGLLELTQAQGADKLKEQYMLRYLLDVETRGSQSLLNVAAFTDPTAYKLKVKRPGSDESREVNVDLLETFNWLIGLTVQHLAAPQTFSAETERDSEGRLRLKSRLKQDVDGRWWFRTVTGTTPDGRKTLVIWRKRPGSESTEGIEQDNLIVDEWFTKQGYSSKDSEFDLIYVNGDNNLENLKTPDDTWKVRLIEEDFVRLMFETEGV